MAADMERVLDLVGEAAMLLEEATDLTPDGMDDQPLWDALQILRDIRYYWKTEVNDGEPVERDA